MTFLQWYVNKENNQALRVALYLTDTGSSQKMDALGKRKRRIVVDFRTINEIT